jgi:hypothetical protein
LIDSVIHRCDQLLNVFPIEGRDKRRAKAQKNFVGNIVGFVLERQNLLKAQLELIAVDDHSAQSDCRFKENCCVPLEYRKEDILARHQSLKPSQHRAPLVRSAMMNDRKTEVWSRRTSLDRSVYEHTP